MYSGTIAIDRFKFPSFFSFFFLFSGLGRVLLNVEYQGICTYAWSPPNRYFSKLQSPNSGTKAK